MIPHAPLRRVLSVTLSGVLFVGLLLYFEHGVFVMGALIGGLIGAALSSLDIFVLRRNAGAFSHDYRFCLISVCASCSMPASSC